MGTVSVGDKVWFDTNSNDYFDPGEGVAGISLTLFLDVDHSGTLTGADTVVATTITASGGTYSFTGLAEGDYVVRVDAANFQAGGALLGDVSVAGANDPDDNVDNDDNGVQFSGYVASRAITLTDGAEPGADPANNGTVDFGFVANQAPAASDDSITVFEDSGANDLTSTLLFNDNDADNDTLTITSGTSGAHGTVSVVAGVLTYTPDANYNGTDSFTYTISDGNGLTDTATASVTVPAVNDAVTTTAPATLSVAEDSANAAVTGLSISDADATLAPAGVYDVTLSATHGSLTLTTVTGLTFTTGDGTSDGSMTFHGTLADINTALATAKYTPDGGYAGSASISLQATDSFGGIVATGTGSATNDSDSISVTVTSSNSAPVLDLDADDSNAVGTGFTSFYTEGGAAAAIADTDVTISDADGAGSIVMATITITNPESGDKLNVGALPANIVVDGSSTDTSVTLIATPGPGVPDFQSAIEAITYSSASDDPTDGGTNTERTITVVVNDGADNSNTATATVTVTDVNDAPAGTDSTITASEDTFRAISASDLGFSDADGTFGSVTINAVTGGKIYLDADGTAGGGAPVEATLPVTFTAQDLIDGKASFKADQSINGSGAGSITFTVTDDDGASAAASNTLTVDVTAVNDSPVLSASSPVSATEQTPGSVLSGVTVVDADLDALNSGSGDYAGAVFTISRNVASNSEDDFQLTSGTNFTVNGANLQAGGLTFGQITADANGVLTISFTSQDTAATSALVDEVLQHISYTNLSDTPPASVQLAAGFTDGSPGGGQGSGATGLDAELVTVNITAVNDAPVNSLGGTIGTGEDAVDAWLSGMSIADPDANPASDDVLVTFDVDHGSLAIKTNVSGGITAGDIVSQDADTITVKATLNEINATLSASNGLTYSPDLNFNGDDTLTVTTNDQGSTGADPGLTGDGTSEEDVDTRTISVSAADDLAIANDDSVGANANAAATGNVFADHGSGIDYDPEGDAFAVTEVNGSAANVGTQITLASGAKVTLNSDGSYSYDPNGKFDGLAASATATDSFTYKLTGGDTATVTVTITGVNHAPDASNDSVTVAEDSGANDLTSTLLSNDTDPDSDTRTITSGTSGTHGTVSVVAGVLTYTPDANYNGSDSFTYTISDGNGHTDTATANVTVTAVSDAVTTAAPATLSVAEDSSNAAVAGLSISDADATLTPAGVYEVTLNATHGSLTLTTLTGLTFSTGDGTGDGSMTFHGTLADINTALATAKYAPDVNYVGSASISFEATDTFGGVVATGTGSASSDSDLISVTVTNVNDAPTGSVSISGTAAEDAMLTASNSLADQDGLGTITYQWLRDGAPIGGATGATYTQTGDDVGHKISVTASYTDGQGTAESKTSAETDTVTGGEHGLFTSGNDVVDFNSLPNGAYEDGAQYDALGGDDTVVLPNRTSVDAGNPWNFRLMFNAGDGDDSVTGGDRNDIIHGGAGDDALHGGLGADRLIGGLGADTLQGDLGADRFVFTSLQDSSGAGIDTILDFSGRRVVGARAQGDKIDLSAIDANVNVVGNQAFKLGHGFTGNAGQAYASYDQGHDVTNVYLDVNGDQIADAIIHLSGNVVLTGSDFIL